jgi:hypothetical protein
MPDDIEISDGMEDAEYHFERFRERVFRAAEDSIEHCTVPVVVEDGTRFIDYRTGVLVQIADMHFLVTAAHWLRELQAAENRIALVMPQKELKPIILMDEMIWSTKDDREDLSVTHLTPPVVNYLKGHYRYVRLSEMMSRDDREQEGGFYLLFGFPFTMMQPDETGIKRLQSWKYLTYSWRGSLEYVARFHPELNQVLKYERNSFSLEGEQVHPPGMSGCGIWFIGNPYTHPLFDENDFKLVGILTAWDEEQEYAKGTWINNVLLIIWKYYPATRKAMMLSGIEFPRH